MTLPSKKRRLFGDRHIGGRRSQGIGVWERGDTLQSLLYGLGMLLLISAVIIGVGSLVYNLATFDTSATVNWGIASVILFVVGFVMKLIGTKQKKKQD
jgi:hypothetical protein